MHGSVAYVLLHSSEAWKSIQEILEGHRDGGRVVKTIGSELVMVPALVASHNPLVILHLIDPSAHPITPHHPRVISDTEGLFLKDGSSQRS